MQPDICFAAASVTRAAVRRLMLLALLLAMVAEPSAAVDSAVKRNLQLVHLDSADGLSQEHVSDIVQDGRGFLWIATQEGLNRYDGYEMHTYEHLSDRADTLSHDFIPVLMVDRAGALWVGTARGVNRYVPEDDAFDRRPFSGPQGDLVGDVHVLDLLEASDGSFWIATQGSGLLHVDPSGATVVRYRHDPQTSGSLPDDIVQALLEDSRGDLWVGTQSGGLSRFDPVSGHFVANGSIFGGRGGAGTGQVRALMEDRSGMIWVGTGDSGAIRFDPKRATFEQFTHAEDDPRSLGDNRVRDIVQDARGSLWFATDGGLSEWRPEEQGFVNYQQDGSTDSLPSDHINTLFTDASGVLWIGTWSGLGKWNYLSDTFTYHRAENGHLPGDVVTSIAEDPDGVLWIGTYGTGLARLDLASGERTFFRHDSSDPSSLPDDRVMSVHVDAAGRVWVGTRTGGLGLRRPGAEGFERFAHDPLDPGALSANAVTSVAVDADDRLWVATFGAGLNRGNAAEPGTFRRFVASGNDPGSISGDRVISLLVDRSGSVWAGTDSNGLNRYDESTEGFDRFGRFASPAGHLSVATVTDLVEDRNGDLWVGTLGQGLIRWTAAHRAAGTAEVTSYGKADGLPTDTIFDILEDQRGALWFSSNRGLTRFDPVDESVRVFDDRSGLRDKEFNQGAGLRSRSGRLLFGSAAGMVSFFPGDIPSNDRQPNVVVTAHSRLEELVSTSSGEPAPQVEISYLDRFVSFDFVALDFTSPDKNRYRYMLDGFDSDWISADAFRRATYTNLPPGDFTFRVQASNNDDVWNRDGASVAVRVVPAPWNTWWAFGGYAALALMLLGTVANVQRSKMRREVEQRARLEQLVEERTEELARRNHDLEQLNSRLAEASVTDSLTGLRNRRYVDQFIESQLALFERDLRDGGNGTDSEGEAPSTMFFMMIDLDGFKTINDRFGHHAGDLALQQVTELLRISCRNSDTLVRWGGDEFLVIGFANAFFGVKILAERIREAVSGHEFDLGNGRHGSLSASIGIAPYPLVEERQWFCSWELVAAVADQAAYIAKASGRNAWVSIAGSENLSADTLEKLGTELPALVESGQIRIDTSLDGRLALPGSAEDGIERAAAG